MGRNDRGLRKVDHVVAMEDDHIQMFLGVAMRVHLRPVWTSGAMKPYPDGLLEEGRIMRIVRIIR